MALFDRSATTYDNWCSTPLGATVDELEKALIAKAADPQPGEKALDLGCGTGIYTLWLAKMGLRVTGIDISREMLHQAREKAARENVQVDLLSGDIHNLPFPDDIFDLVIGNIVLEFVDDPKQVVSEALRVIKKGGRLVIGLIHPDGYWGRTYASKGRQDKDSVFAGAKFYDEATIRSWEPAYFDTIDYGLYITPDNFNNREQALQLEKKMSQEKNQQQAGYVVARWVKSLS
ncbi:MAG: methyltransferase domain-containing protein [Bacillaceae bacterium]|nr:methyltransferase domain-containing protein [Bacillaceae bacterium]